jgi:hypothetical protein
MSRPTGTLAPVACSDDEKLAEIERRMPADSPPKRTRDPNADTEKEGESENHSDIDCIFMRLLQMIASKERGGDQGC